MNTQQSNRPLFSISIAASLTGLHSRTLMAYERNQLVAPHRTKGQRRLYSYNDLKTIHFLQFLTQKKSVNLAGAKVILEAIEAAKEHNLELKKKLFPEYREATQVNP